MYQLSDPERHVVETAGEFIRFWGFSKHHGRIWALLYLSEEPLSSPDIQEVLEMSAGLVSMSIKELLHWDVIEKVWIKGERKDYYKANSDVWHMIARVMREREYHTLQSSIRELDDALGELETTQPNDMLTQERLEYVKPRVDALIGLAQTVSTVLNMLLNQAELNIEELKSHAKNLPE